MKRLYVERKDIMHHDSIHRDAGMVYYSPIHTTGNRDNFKAINIKVYSVKTGKQSRRLTGKAVEIENMSGIFVLLNTAKKVRTKEMAYVDSTPCDLIPVARLKQDNTLICSLVTAGKKVQA